MTNLVQISDKECNLRNDQRSHYNYGRGFRYQGPFSPNIRQLNIKTNIKPKLPV